MSWAYIKSGTFFRYDVNPGHSDLSVGSLGKNENSHCLPKESQLAEMRIPSLRRSQLSHSSRCRSGRVDRSCHKNLLWHMHVIWIYFLYKRHVLSINRTRK